VYVPNRSVPSTSATSSRSKRAPRCRRVAYRSAVVEDGANAVLFIGDADYVDELRSGDLRRVGLVSASMKKPSLFELGTRLLRNLRRKRR
jgi:hypothetical protein